MAVALLVVLAPAALTAAGPPAARVAADLLVAAVPADPLLAGQWGALALNAPQAWRIEPGSPGVVVALVDTGLETAHPDLASVPRLPGHDWVDGDDDPEDEHGHGTHVAGIVAAARDNAAGVAGLARVTLLPLRVLDAQGSGSCADVVEAIREAVLRGADVINLSLHCDEDWPPLAEAVAQAAASGVVVVAAAGNFAASAPERCVVAPARYPGAIAVAALDPTLEAASYSCRGPEIALAAPGSRVLSTFAGGYAFLSGTSMAAPHVSGAAALLLSREPTLGEAGVRARLLASARDLGAEGRDDAYGEGMVDPVAALAGESVWVPPPPAR